MERLNAAKSLLALFACTLLVLFVARDTRSSVFNWDSAGYYYYLPALVIHGDLSGSDITWMEEARVKYDLSGTLYQFHKVEETGNFVCQYSSGMAILYSPGFFAGHLAAKISGAEQDGFSAPYQWAMWIWSMVVMFLGLLLFRKFLLFHFDDGLTAVLLVLTTAGTNYLLTVAYGLSTVHCYVFFLYALLLYLVHRWTTTGSLKLLGAVALTFGIACLSRPSEMVAFFIPLFYGVGSLNALWERIGYFFRRFGLPLLLVIFIVAISALPQLLYWKLCTGHWFFMSYANPAEGFDFTSPHTMDFLFSYRKGWFVYTPLMFIAVLSMVGLWKWKRDLFWAVALFSIANVYFLSSWSSWWYAQCFSQRTMVQSLPVTILPLGFLIHFLRGLARSIVIGIVSILLITTVFFMWQYKWRIISKDRMTGEYFWTVFGKTNVPEMADTLLLVERSFTGEMDFDASFPETYKVIRTDQYPSAETDFADTLLLDSLVYKVQRLNQERKYSTSVKRRFGEWTSKDHAWLRITAEVFVPEGIDPRELRIVATADHEKKLYGYITSAIAEHDSLPGWKSISMDYLTPEVRDENDKISTYLWWRGEGEIFIRSFRVDTYERR